MSAAKAARVGEEYVFPILCLLLLFLCTLLLSLIMES